MVQQGPEKSQEDSRSLEKRLVALKAAIMERLMYSSRAELAQLPVGSCAPASRPGQAGTAPACPAAAAAWARGNWSRSVGAWPGCRRGGEGALGEPARVSAGVREVFDYPAALSHKS